MQLRFEFLNALKELDMGWFKCNLKEYRLKAGLSQEELAQIVDARRETINRLEAGRYNPSLKLAVDISRAVHASIEEIFIFPEE